MKAQRSLAISNFGYMPLIPLRQPMLGKTAQYQKADLLTKHKDRYYNIGWFQFAGDGGFYFQFHYNRPMICQGLSDKPGGVLKPDTVTDLRSLPERHRHHLHISLHPSGVMHVRGASHPPLVQVNLGKWLPPRRPVLLAHLCSPEIAELPSTATAKPGDAILQVRDMECGVTAEIKLLPKNLLMQHALMGSSHRFNVAIRLFLTTPAIPHITIATALSND